MENTNKYALITGATSGIGYELAKVFASEGYNLVIVGRYLDSLEEKANEFASQFDVNIVPIAKDLFESEAAFELYDEVKAKGIEVDVLVNDAGQGVYGLLTNTDIRKQLQIIQLNISSLTALTYLFLKDMVARNEGKILQLGSVASEVPSPYQAVYGATKAYILMFSEAIRNELKDTNVTVTTLQPGETDTDFFNKAGAQNSKMVEDPSKLADPADVAKDGYDALMNDDDKVVSGLSNKIQIALGNVTPDTMLAERMNSKSEESDKK